MVSTQGNRSGSRRGTGAVNRYVGHRVRMLRMLRRLTSLEVARRAGLAPGSYSCLENGWYRISLDNLFRIIQVLGVQVTEVWPNISRSEVSSETHEEPSLEKLLAELLDRRLLSTTAADIVEAVSLTFGISSTVLRKKGIPNPRVRSAKTACALLAREDAEVTVSDLATHLNCSLSTLSGLIRRYRGAREKLDFTRKLSEVRRILQEHRAPDANPSSPGAALLATAQSMKE